MPKSKRDKKISLTRVEKKNGLETKTALVEKVRSAVDNYARYSNCNKGLMCKANILFYCRVFVFQYENMRNAKLKTVRDEWSHSKFFIGKNRVLAKALGNSEAEEYSDNLHLVSRCLKNECGLLATNQSQDDVIEYFTHLSEPDFARTGGVAADTVELKQGALEMFPHSMEPQLRKMGMPVQLVKGQVMCLVDFTVCNKGDTLTSEQARILKLLGHQHAEFRLNIVSGWSKEGGKFELFKEIEMREPRQPSGENNLGSGGEAEEDSEDNFEDDA